MATQRFGSPIEEEETRRKPWLEITLLSAFLVSLFIGLAALAGFLLYDRSAGVQLSDDPLTVIDPAQIAPALALRALGGDPANALAYQALNAGELATAQTLARFDVSAVGSQRAGLLMQLARAYAEQDEATQAALIYRLAQPLALLDPTVPPLERGRDLVQVADGFLQAGEFEAARDSAYQAMTTAAQLPNLTPAQRADLFNRLIPVAKALEDATLLQALEDLARNPFLAPAGVLLAPRLAQLTEPLPLDEAVRAAESARQTAARQLADRIQYTGGQDIEPERLALEAALRTEDQVRNAYLGRLLSDTLSSGQQLTLLGEHRRWTALRLQAASRGFGISLMPDWEANRSFIVQDLDTISANMDVIMDQLAQEQATPLEQTNLQTEGLRWLALQHDLGLYPGAPVSSLSQRLEIAQNSLAGLGQSLALPVIYRPEAIPPGFRLQTAAP